MYEWSVAEAMPSTCAWHPWIQHWTKHVKIPLALRGWRRWFGGSAWISQSGPVKWWSLQAWKAMWEWGERINYSSAWPDLQEFGLNISLHWPCCQHKQMRMVLIRDAAQRLLEMYKLPKVAMRWEEEGEAHVLIMAFWKRKPLPENSCTASCPSALVNLSVQWHIFLMIFVSCLFHFLLKNCCVTCSVL
jgi:hypothetical protein